MAVKRKMLIDVALVPIQHYDISRSVCIVVDVLRASSTIVVLLERGARAVLPAASIEQARKAAHGRRGALLCGEENSLPPSGFAYGNSPVEFQGLALAGRLVILATSNGTRTLRQVTKAPVVLVGCLLNRSAVAASAFAIASSRELNLTIICAGADGGHSFTLEDAIGAGAIVDAACRRRRALQLTDGARAALGAFRAYRRRLAKTIASTDHACNLISLGLGEDVTFCARLDAYNVVPHLQKAGADWCLVLA